MKEKERTEVIGNMLNIANTLQKDLAQNKQEIENIQFYKDFQFAGTNLGVNNVYVVKIKDDTVPEKSKEPRKEENFQYRIYDEDNKLIASVNERGQVIFSPEFLEEIDKRYLDSLNLEEAEFELPEELKEEDLILSKEELQEKAEERRLDDVSKVMEGEKIESYSEMKTDQTPTFNRITNKQELDPNTRVTQSETLGDMIPELKEKGIVKVGVVYSDYSKGQNGRFSFVGIDKDGQIHSIDSLENTQGTTTGQNIISINSRDGSLVEEEQVAGMVRINGRSRANGQEEFLSVKVGNYGILEVDYVRADLSQNKDERYFSAPIETKNIRPTTREVRETMDKHRNTEIDTELERAEEATERDGETSLNNIDDTASNDYVTPDDVILLEDGTETTLRKEAEKAKVSPEEFTRKYNDRGGKTPDEKIEAIHEEIEQEFGAPTLEH